MLDRRSLFAALVLLVAGDFSARAFDLLHPFGSAKGTAAESATPPVQAGGQRQRESEFLQRIRRSDPNRRTFEKALFNSSGELAVILSRQVPLDSVPTLMKALLVQMAKAFPGRNLTIVAYAPSNPPLKVGTARLNAQNRNMTYEHAR